MLTPLENPSGNAVPPTFGERPEKTTDMMQWGKIFEIGFQVQLKLSLEGMLRDQVNMPNNQDTDQKICLHIRMCYPIQKKDVVLKMVTLRKGQPFRPADQIKYTSVEYWPSVYNPKKRRRTQAIIVLKS